MFSRTRGFVSIGVFAAMTGFIVPSQARAQAVAPKLDDPTIVAIFDAANTYDIETGKLAVSKARSKEAHEFGEMLVRDHTNHPRSSRTATALRTCSTISNNERTLR